MPKKKIKKEYRKLNKKIIFAAALICIGLSAFYIPGAVKQKHLENKFSQLEKDIDSLKLELENKFPDKKFEKDRYCQKNAQVWIDGPLHCDITLKGKNKFSQQQATEVVNLINKNTKWQEQTIPQTIEPFSQGLSKNNATGFKCLIIFYATEEISEKELKPVDFEIWCSEISKKSFYPYRDN